MSLFDLIFGNRPKPEQPFAGGFKMLNGYVPKFTTFNGSIYENELIRAAIHARATHISKLKVEITGAAKPALKGKLLKGPNQLQTWPQFLYRLSTILDIHNVCIITPVFDQYGQISGIYTPLPTRCEIVEYGDVPYVRYEFANGKKAAIELENCCILNKFQYKSDFFGENNHALLPTMDLIKIQEQGIAEGVKSAASFRFWGRVTNFSKSADIAKERKRFTAENFSNDSSGVLLFPNTYTDLHQVDAKPWVVDAEQMAAIKSGVFDYFQINEDVLQSKAIGDAYSGFYETVVEKFAIDCSDGMTKMLYTFREQSEGNAFYLTSNRLQFMSNADKLSVSAQMADRGLMTRNEIREIWQLPPLPDPIGNQLPVRGEYYNVTDDTDGGNTDGE